MPIIRADHRGGKFTQLDNRAVRDKRLSGEARGALAWFLSQRETFEPSAEILIGQGFGSKDRCQRIMLELRKYGYATTQNVATTGGRRRVLTTVSELPQQLEQCPPELESTAPASPPPEPCFAPPPEPCFPTPGNTAAKEGIRATKKTKDPIRKETLTSSSSLAGAPHTGPVKSGSANPRRASAAEIWERIRRPTWEPTLTVEELRAAFRLAFTYAGFPEPITSAEHGRWGKAVKDLMDSTVTPREFYLAATVAKGQWIEAPASHTPMAIVANLAQLLEDGELDDSFREDHESGWNATQADAWRAWLASVGEYTLQNTVEYSEVEYAGVEYTGDFDYAAEEW